MFLNLRFKTFEVYVIGHLLLKECYLVTDSFPKNDQLGLAQQVRNAALSVQLNIVRAFSRLSERERKDLFEAARGGIGEVQANLEIAVAMDYLPPGQLNYCRELIQNEFEILTGMIEMLRVNLRKELKLKSFKHQYDLRQSKQCDLKKIDVLEWLK